MELPDPLVTVTASDLAEVTRRIVQRYANPGRSAYMMMFNIAPQKDFSEGPFAALVPDEGVILAAWMDEGSGLAPAAIPFAVDRANTIRREATDALSKEHKQTSSERRRQMARAIIFSTSTLNDGSESGAIEVMLVSRSLTFSPKGDRQVRELWKRGEAGWFSAYQPDRDAGAGSDSQAG